VVYLPVKFRHGSVHFPRRYSPHNPDVRLISHYGVRIFSGSFLRYCCRSPLCPALRTASPKVPVHCLAHIFPACSLSPPRSWSARSPCQSCVKDVLWSSQVYCQIEKSSLVVSVSPEPSAYGPFLPDTCHVHLPLSFVSLPWMHQIQYSIRFPTFRWRPPAP